MLTVAVQNIGFTLLNLLSADYFVNAIASTITGTCSTALQPQQSCTLVIATYTTFLVQGSTYTFKIALPDGVIFSYSLTYGGSSSSPIYPTVNQPTQVPNTPSSQPASSSFTIPPRYDYYYGLDLTTGDTVVVSFSASSWRGSDGVSFTIISSNRTILLNAGKVAQYSGNYTAVFPGRYYMRFDNSYSGG